MMKKYFLIIVFVKFIQCEINTTINKYFPLMVVHSSQNLPLTEQDIYDLKNDMRKANELNDFDDDDDYDYNEDEEIVLTTPEIKYEILKSSSPRFVLKFINLLVLLFFTQTNK